MDEKFYLFNANGDKKYRVYIQADDCDKNPIAYSDVKMFIDTKFCNENTMAHLFPKLNHEYFKENFDQIFQIMETKEDESKYQTALRSGYVIMPIWEYSHSGVSFSASEINPYDKRDSSLAGYCWTEVEHPEDERVVLDAKEKLIDAIDEYNAYFNHEIYAVDIDVVYGEVGGSFSLIFKTGDPEKELLDLVRAETNEIGGTLTEIGVEEYKNLGFGIDKVQTEYWTRDGNGSSSYILDKAEVSAKDGEKFTQEKEPIGKTFNEAIKAKELQLQIEKENKIFQQTNITKDNEERAKEIAEIENDRNERGR